MLMVMGHDEYFLLRKEVHGAAVLQVESGFLKNMTTTFHRCNKRKPLATTIRFAPISVNTTTLGRHAHKSAYEKYSFNTQGHDSSLLQNRQHVGIS